MRAKSAAGHGMTLFEVVVTITLIGLIATVAAPSLPTLRSTDDRAARVAEAFRLGAARAAVLGVPVSIATDLPRGWILVGPAEGVATDSILLPPGAGSSGRVIFLPDGRAAGDTIHVRDAATGAQIASLYVLPWNGRVVLSRP